MKIRREWRSSAISVCAIIAVIGGKSYRRFPTISDVLPVIACDVAEVGEDVFVLIRCFCARNCSFVGNRRDVWTFDGYFIFRFFFPNSRFFAGRSVSFECW